MTSILYGVSPFGGTLMMILTAMFMVTFDLGIVSTLYYG